MPSPDSPVPHLPAADLPPALVGIVSLWAATFLYGINVVMFIICVAILIKRRTRGDRVPWFLLGGICLQFLLCTAHNGVILGAGVHAFKTTTTTSEALIESWISILGPYTETQQVLYAFNNFFGDLILIWRLYVVYGNNWYITIVPLLLALASEGCTQYAGLITFIDPAVVLREQANGEDVVSKVVTAGFAMTAATQLLVTLLLAVRIYTASRSIRQLSGNRKTNYSGVMWMLVESGAAMAAADIVFLAVWRTGLEGISQVVLAILGQLCAMIPLSIVTRVGLRLAFDGSQSTGGMISVSSPSRFGGSSGVHPFRFAHSGNTSTNNDTGTSHLSELNWAQGSQKELNTAV
ncbi:hypothetical protein B0H17DRAFT_1036834 [Mycena rosella]|uniref:Uncharacterized protein n=1 Tax=Mycena rosella TaxID=1033263 RepID=A0AAD7GVV5_MYCRO|nr:hypothetical protein B0H17DRAFT_1036834 [Mycena rosella]